MYENLKYGADPDGNNVCIIGDINDVTNCIIPIDPANRHYAEIMRQVKAGELTIADAD